MIKVQGEEIDEFLQGLITNDINHLDHMETSPITSSSIFAMFLNTQGRVLFDTFIVKAADTDGGYFLDCDQALSAKLGNHEPEAGF